MEVVPRGNPDDREKYLKSCQAKPVQLILTLSTAVDIYLLQTDIRNHLWGFNNENRIVINVDDVVTEKNKSNITPLELAPIFGNDNLDITANKEKNPNFNVKKLQALRAVNFDKRFKVKYENNNYSRYSGTDETFFGHISHNTIMMILSANQVIGTRNTLGRINNNETNNQQLISYLPVESNTVLSHYKTFLEIIKIAFNTFLHVLEFISLKANLHEANKSVILKIDTRQFLRYLSLQLPPNEMTKPSSQESMLQVCCSPNIGILSLCLSFFDIWLLFSKFVSNFKIFLETIGMLCNCYSNCTIDNNECNNVLSTFNSGWHVKDFTHGYFLTRLLKDSHVTSIHVMKKLYFVIITCNTSNPPLMLNFKLTHSIHITYGMKVIDLSLNFSQWIIINLKSHSKIAKTNNAICEVKPVYHISTHNTYISKSESNYTYESKTTQQNNISIGDSDEDFDNSIYYSDLESVDFKSSFSSIDIKDSIQTLTLSIDTMPSVHDVRKDCGDTKLTNLIRKDNFKSINESMLNMGTVWLKNLYEKPITLSTDLDISRFICSVDESIFDRTSFDCCHKLSNYWAQLKSEMFSKPFVKHLGYSIFNTMFSSVIPL